MSEISPVEMGEHRNTPLSRLAEAHELSPVQIRILDHCLTRGNHALIVTKKSGFLFRSQPEDWRSTGKPGTTALHDLIKKPLHVELAPQDTMPVHVYQRVVVNPALDLQRPPLKLEKGGNIFSRDYYGTVLPVAKDEVAGLLRAGLLKKAGGSTIKLVFNSAALAAVSKPSKLLERRTRS